MGISLIYQKDYDKESTQQATPNWLITEKNSQQKNSQQIDFKLIKCSKSLKNVILTLALSLKFSKTCSNCFCLNKNLKTSP